MEALRIVLFGRNCVFFGRMGNRGQDGAGNQDKESEDVFFLGNLDLTLVFGDDVGNRADTESVAVFVLLGGDGYPVFEMEFSVAVIGFLDLQEVLLGLTGKLDETEFALFFFRGFDRIVEDVSEKGGDIRRFHETEGLAVDDVGEGDLLGIAEKPLLGQNDIEGIIAGLGDRGIDVHASFQFVDRIDSVLSVEVFDGIELVFHVVNLQVQDIGGFFS